MTDEQKQILENYEWSRQWWTSKNEGEKLSSLTETLDVVVKLLLEKEEKNER